MSIRDANDLPSVAARIAYLDAEDGRAGYRTWPASTGRPVETPPKRHYQMRIQDCRPVSSGISLDREGFAHCRHTSRLGDFYDDELVRRDYYPETAALLREATGALAVLP
ncbi:MAG: CmcJ/NvfI family oxidoreductase, partial [Candidatus Binatia bacterium]